MKRLLFTLITTVLVARLFAQAPSRLSYQAVVRSANSQLVVNHAVGMRVSLLQGSITGTSVYMETITPTTNANGLVSIAIGNETGFSTIDWANGPYFIKTEIDPTGGTNYTITGVSQLLSVPYALHANTAERLSVPFVESDPVFAASPAKTLTSSLIINWNTAYAWGNHAGLYRPISWLPSWQEILNKPVIEPQKLSTKKDTLKLSGGGGEIIFPDSSNINELQTLLISNDSIYLKGKIVGSNSVVKLPVTKWGDILEKPEIGEAQKLTLVKDKIQLSGGGGEVILADTSSTNELQFLSVSNDTIFLKDKNATENSFVKMPQGDYTKLLNLPNMDYYRTIVAYTEGNSSFVLDTRPAIVKSVTITVPVEGKIVVGMDAYAYFYGTDLDVVRGSISATDAVNYDHLVIITDQGSTSINDRDYHSFSSQRVYPVNAGTYTFNFVADRVLIDASSRVDDINMTAVFYPDTQQPALKSRAQIPSIETFEMSKVESEKRGKLLFEELSK